MSAAPTFIRGMLLFAHGARDPKWAEPFAAIAARVRNADPALRVELAFLEFMTPDFATAAAGLAAACTTIDIVPLFLGAGGHVRKDLPVLVEAMRAAHPQIGWTLHAPVGELPAVITAIADAAITLGDVSAPTRTATDE